MNDPTATAILDATRASILDFGIRRTTLSDIARRAGVSRVTVYRRYPDADAVLRALMTREFGELMEGVGANVGGRDARARVVARLSASVRALRGHPLLRKVLEVEPELLLPYLLRRMGETQRHGLGLMTKDIAEGQKDGSVREGDARTTAQLLLLLAQAVVLSGATVEDMAEETLQREFERVVDAALAPA
ncbi:MAG: hypothetical protein V7607_1720 [Solirubrobacteraceae bacterium]